MPKRKRTTELQVTSISAIHDPNAAKKWMDIYVKLLKKQLLDENAALEE